MNMLKRTLAMFLVLCMLIGALPLSVFADETDGTVVTEPEETVTETTAAPSGDDVDNTPTTEAPSEPEKPEARKPGDGNEPTKPEGPKPGDGNEPTKPEGPKPGDGTTPTTEEPSEDDGDVDTAPTTEEPSEDDEDVDTTPTTEEPSENDEDVDTAPTTEEPSEDDEDVDTTPTTEEPSEDDEDVDTTPTTEEPSEDDEDVDTAPTTEEPSEDDENVDTAPTTEEPSEDDEDVDTTPTTEEPSDDDEEEEDPAPTEAPEDEIATAGIASIEMGNKPADGTTKGEPFPKGTAGSNSFRIPALVTLSNGTMIAAADARWNTTYDGGGLDTIVSYSTDGGATWNYTFANYLGDHGNEYNGSKSTAFIDPALTVVGDTVYMLVDLYPYGVALNGSGHTNPVIATGFNADGKLLLSADNHQSYNFYLDGDTIYTKDGTPVEGYTVDAYFNITEESTNLKSNLFFSNSPYKVVRTGFLYLTKSVDGGKTWSEPELLNLKNGSEQVCLVAPGRGLVTSDGMIVYPVYSFYGDNEPSGNSQRMSFVYSYDGVNWARSKTLNYNWSSESVAVELNNGALRFFFRNGTTNLCYVDYSNGAWETPVVLETVDTNSNCQISAISYSKTVDGKQVILVSCPTGPNEGGSNLSGASSRLNGKIFAFTVGEDGFMSLVGEKNVTSGGAQFMYSCLTELADGSVAILYEDCEAGWGTGSDKYYTMDFSKYDLVADFGLTFDSEEEPEETTKPTEPEETTKPTEPETEPPVETDPSEPETEPPVETEPTEPEDKTVPDEKTGVVITAPGLETVEVEAQEAVVEEGVVTKTYTISLNGGDYTDAATVKIPYDPAFDGYNFFIGYVGEDAFTVTKDGDFFVCEVPHFSDVRIEGRAITDADKVVEGEGMPESYVKDTDGADNNTKYLVVYDDNAMAYNGSSFTSVAVVENEDGTLTISDSSDITNAIWIRQNNGLYNEAQKRYLSIGNNSISGSNNTQNVTFSSYSNGYQVYLDGRTDYYLRYNSGWASTNRSNSATRINLYAYTPGTQTYTVVADGQAALITENTIPESENVYTEETWNAYQTALTAAKNKLAEVTAENQTYSPEAAATAALNEVVTAVNNLVTAKNNLKKAVQITINYQENGTTVKTETRNVEEGTASIKLSETVSANGKTYSVKDITLKLSSNKTTYNVAVTELQGLPVSIPQGNEQKISVTLGENQYVEWSSADSAYVGVAGVYNATSKKYTNEAVLKGVQKTGDTTITVVGTVYNSDGTVAGTYKWIVTVTDADGSVAARSRYYSVDQVVHATIYYSINGGELVRVNGDGIYIDPDNGDDGDPAIPIIEGNWYDDLSLLIFSAPEEGYALSHMFVEDSDGSYYVLSDGGDAGATASSAWPMLQGVDPDAVYTANGHTYSMDEVASLYSLGYTSNSDIYGIVKADGDIWKVDGKSTSGGLHGLRWALLEGYLDANRLLELYNEALALGCTGVTTLTKGYSVTSDTGTSSDPISFSIVAQELPTFEKTIASIEKPDGSTISDVANAHIEIGDTLNYKITVTIPATNKVARYRDGNNVRDAVDKDGKALGTTTISYSNINATDTMYDLKWSTNNTTSVTSSTKTDTVLTSEYGITLASSNWLQYVTDGKIINTATLTYNYKAEYGAGNFSGSDETAVEAHVVLPEYVIDFGATITIDLKNDPLVKGYDTLASAEAMYGDVTFNENELVLTYTPTQILPGMDFIRLTVADKDGNSQDAIQYGVRIYPATSVYYEEGFMFPENEAGQLELKGWDLSKAVKYPGSQTSEKLSPPVYDQETGAITGYTSGKVNPYGYDVLYADSTEGSKNSYAVSSASADAASFTFTGTGFAIYANSSEFTGCVYVYKQGNFSKLYMIDTKLERGETSATNQNQGGTYYSLPIVSETDLAYGTYTVTLKQFNSYPVHLDGVRIYGTLADSSVFAKDGENSPKFYELRDYVLNAVGVEELNKSDYIQSNPNNDRDGRYEAVSQMAGQVYNALGNGEKAVLITEFDVDDEGFGELDSAQKTEKMNKMAQDLLDNGPKNELHLYPGQTLIFSVTSSSNLQLGLKSPKANAKFTLKVNDVTDSLSSMTSTVDMFYQIAGAGENTVAITVTEGVLSVTTLKVCGDPNVAFNSLTQDDIKMTLMSVYGVEDDDNSLKITVQPENVTAANGEAVNTTVTASGEGLTYQWYYTSNGKTNVFYKSSVKTATYSTVMDATRAGRRIYCVISDANGNTVTSDVVTLSMDGAVQITAQPENVTAANGEAVNTTVTASGEGLTYQWYYTSNGKTNVFYKSSVKTATYSTVMDATRAGRRIYCVITDKYGNCATTEVVTLSMEGAVQITAQPGNVTAVNGADVNVSVSATGDGLTYQWYYTSNGKTNVFYKSSVKTATYSTVMDATRAGRRIYCVITDAYGNSVTSEVVVLNMK